PQLRCEEVCGHFSGIPLSSRPQIAPSGRASPPRLRANAHRTAGLVRWCLELVSPSSIALSTRISRCRNALSRWLEQRLLLMKAMRKIMVGTGRFELPTPRTPSECSTRLSHVPTQSSPLRGEPAFGVQISLHHPGLMRPPTRNRRLQRMSLRRRNKLLGHCRPGAEKELFHLFHKKGLRLRGPGLQAVLVQQHLLPLSPLCPGCLRDVLEYFLTELRVERRLIKAFHLFLVPHAKNHMCHL